MLHEFSTPVPHGAFFLVVCRCLNVTCEFALSEETPAMYVHYIVTSFFSLSGMPCRRQLLC